MIVSVNRVPLLWSQLVDVCIRSECEGRYLTADCIIGPWQVIVSAALRSS
jgi:hypothetical protein